MMVLMNMARVMMVNIMFMTPKNMRKVIIV